ncbi:MAG: PHB depolymerase family esterase [Candidatus Acidiferrales bacterium]
MRTRIRRVFILSIVVLLLCAIAWRHRKAVASPAPESAAATQAGTRSGSMEFGGLTRTYLLHIPPGYDGTTPMPLVFVLHGATQSTQSVESMSGMSAKADQQHFLAIYPSGTGRISDIPTWNAGNCCGYAIENHVDDIGFLRALLAELERDYSIDRKRIYFTGISNGAMMSYRVACEMSDQVAAISPVEGAQNVDCRPAARVSVLTFHGTDDHLVPFDGGSTPFQIGGKRTDNSVAYAVDFWIKRDACPSPPTHEEVAEAQVDKYSGCKDGTAVELYAIQGGHHMWPGHPLSGNSVPATDLIWSFFAAHPKP